MKLKKWIPVGPATIAIGLAAVAWSVSVAYITAQAPAQSPADRGMLAGEVFKNVQAMKDVPVDDFLTSMGLMCAALGNDCADCHENAGTQYVDWAADSPKKRTARRMVTMVNTINKDNFNGRVVVTCWTCHRNREKPETSPTMELMYGEPPPGHDDVLVPLPGAPPAGPILDKYLAAIGGTDRLSRITSYEATANSIFYAGFGGGGKVRIYAQAPDKRSTIIEFPEAPDRGDSTRSYNGTDGWIRTPLSVLGEYKLRGTELDGARFDALMAFPQQIKTALTNLRVGSADPIDGKTIVHVQGEGPNNLLVSMYFETESGLLKRIIRYGRTPIGRIPTQIDVDEYHDVQGVKMPFKWTFSWLDGRDQFQITDVKTNVAIDRNRFEKPSLAVRR